MTAKNYLRQIKKADIRINNLISEKEQLATLAECAGAIPISEKVQSSPRADKMENAIVKMVQVEIELGERIDDFVDIKRKIIRQIEEVGDERYYNILFKRNVELKDSVTKERKMG